MFIPYYYLYWFHQSRIWLNTTAIFFLLHNAKPCSYSVIFISIQLKNQIAALYSSRKQSTKNFEIDGIGFGWKAIEDQYKRDRLRADQGCAPHVPGLWYNFVYQDVWTRLNVLPAKIMQVNITTWNWNLIDKKWAMLCNSWKVQ